MKYKEMLAYVTFLNSTQGNDTEAWKNAIHDVNVLMEYMGPYQVPQADGSYRPIEPEAYETIGELFDRTVASMNAFVKEQGDMAPDDFRYLSAKNFSNEFLSKAYVEYKNVKPSPDLSLRDAMENFRYENVDLTSDELNRVGGNLSSRIQLSVDLDGKKTRGVFTKKTAYDPNGQYGKLLDEMDLKYGKFASFWDSLDDVDFLYSGLRGINPMLFCHSETGTVYDANPELKEQSLVAFESNALLSHFPEALAEFEKYRNDPDFFNALFDFAVKSEKLGTSIGVNEEFLEIKPGTNIDSRNSAMSSVANLIGVSDLIAKSKQLSVHMPDGSAQTGTFMEFVDSKDVNKLDSIDEMRIYGLDAYEGEEVKVQLSNLQVLDYICGNVDRHLGNILYKFDPNTHKLSSIKGIDNDASFFKRPLDISLGLGELCSLRQMRVIDEEMAQKLLTIDEGMLSATLHGYGLSEAEVNASYQRLHNLQEAIRSASVYDPEQGLPEYDGNGAGYGITIVRREDWESLKLEDLRAGKNNFAKIIDAQKTLTTQKMVTGAMRQTSECAKRSLKSMLSKDNTKQLLDAARNHKPIMGTSQRYLNVLSALENYHNAPAPEDPLHSEGGEKWERLTELKRAVDAYKQEKIRLGHLNRDGTMARDFTGKALSRIEDVDKIGKFADKLFEQRKQAMDAEKAVLDGQRKQQELDAFKSLPPEKQQFLLDKRREEEEMLNQDLSLRIQDSLEQEEEFFMNGNDFDLGEDLSIDNAGVEMN